MYIVELFTEASQTRVVVTYPGRFQPFHKGHAGVFTKLQAQFGGDNVFVVTSNDQSSDKSPFNFSDKVKFITAAGVPANSVIQQSSPYQLPSNFDPASTIFITAVGAPDADRLKPDSVKKDGNPGFFKKFKAIAECETADKSGYVIVIPEIKASVNIGGKVFDVSHGTECRNLWNQIRNNNEQRLEFVQQLYGRNDPELANVLDKIPAGSTVKEGSQVSRQEVVRQKEEKLKKVLNTVKHYGLLDPKNGDKPKFAIKVKEGEWHDGDNHPEDAWHSDSEGAQDAWHSGSSSEWHNDEGLSENTKDRVSVEYRGIGYVIYFSQKRGQYTARGTGEGDGQIQPRWFDSMDDAIEHADLEISGRAGYGMEEGSSGAKYKVKVIGRDSKGDYYVSPSTGKKVYRSGVNRGDHEVPQTGEIKKTVAEGGSTKSGIYQTDVYGTKAYFAKCMEQDCGWKSKSFDRIKQAQQAAQKHAEQHVNKKDLDEAESNPAYMSPQDYERYQQSSMDADRRAFKRAELQHELGHEDEWERRRQQKPKVVAWVFYNVTPENQSKASMYNIRQLKNGKWAMPEYDRSGRTYAFQRNEADKVFGPGRRWVPKQQGVAEGYWQDALKKTMSDREARKGKPFEKNPLSHDKNGVYIGDKDLAGNPVPKKKQQGVAEGMLDNPGQEDSPVAQAIIRRILMQRTDLLAKYGPEKVGAAVDDVADFVGDAEEIGSSDVSGWVRQVEQSLSNMSENEEQGVGEGSSAVIAQTVNRLTNPNDGKVAKLRAAGDKRREDQLKYRDIKKKNKFEGMYQYNKEDPYNSEFAPEVGMGRMTLRGWKQNLARRVAEFDKRLQTAMQSVDNPVMWDNIYTQFKSLNLDPIAQEIQQAHKDLDTIRRKGGKNANAFKSKSSV